MLAHIVPIRQHVFQVGMMEGRMLKIVAALAALGPVSAMAQVPDPAPVNNAPAALTVQQQFDVGTTAIEAADWQKALDIYSTLDTRLTKGNAVSRSLAIVRLRKGMALFHLGKTDDAETMMEQATSYLPASDESLKADRYQATNLLSDAAELRYDYPRSISWLNMVRESAGSDRERLLALTKLVRTGIFVDPVKALADADAATALLAVDPKPDPETSGLVSDLRGRALLNLSRFKEARTELGQAIKLLGGLSYSKATLSDTITRSDAAIAALLDNDPSKARELLAYAGAAMQADQGFELGRDMRPPVCGGPNGPKPDDVAIVEFAIRDNGSVAFARPIYFSGKPEIAAQFAQVVSEWSWSAEELKKVHPFLRQQTRIELRCTTISNGPGIFDILATGQEVWLKSKSVARFAPANAGQALQLIALKKELAVRETSNGNQSVQLLPLLSALVTNHLVAGKEANNYAARALQIATAEAAPPSVRIYYLIGVAMAHASHSHRFDQSDFGQLLRAYLTDQAISSDANSKGALSIALYDSLSRSRRRTDGASLLQALVDDKIRTPNDPFRVGALIRLANLDYLSGKIDSARSYFDQSGLSGQQCALVDAKPRQTGGTISDSDYPMTALFSGFSGWTEVEFDIDAAGKTVNPRALISFPPFIFGEPTVSKIKSWRYEQSYRPAGGLGCGGQRQRVTYRARPK
jgi:tetratricopeptide (TPR) repeat protein